MNAVSPWLVSSQILRRLSASAQPACACAVQSLPRTTAQRRAEYAGMDGRIVRMKRRPGSL
jgi:hypothetical protein